MRSNRCRSKTVADALKPVPGLRLRREGSPAATSVFKAIFLPADHWPERLLTERVVPVPVRSGRLLHVMEPALAEEILRDDGARFGKHGIYRRIAGAESGPRSMIAVEGEQTREVKAAFGPCFNSRRALSHAAMMRAVTARLSQAWSPAGGPVDVFAAASAIAFEIIWRVLFDPEASGAPPPDFVQDNAGALHRARLTEDYRQVAALISDTARRSLARAERCPGGQAAFLGAAAGEWSRPLDAATRFDNIRLFLSAGHKTIAAAIAWTLWLLARAPEEAARAAAEADTLIAAGDDALVDAVRGSRLAAVLDEAMRLFPPAVLTVREARQDTRLGDWRLRAGAPVVVNFYAMHRHRTLWPDPDAFRPERFLPSAAPLCPRGAFRPFSAGAYACPGARFAEIEALVILSELLRRFRFTCGPTPPEPTYSITLHMWRGATLEARARR